MRAEWVGLLGVAMLGLAGGAAAQTVPAMHAAPVAAMSTTNAASDLPDAPMPAAAQEPPRDGSMAKDVQNAQDAGIAPHHQPLLAPKYNFYIHQGQTSQPLTGMEKVKLSFVEEIDGSTELTSVLSGTLSQLDNSDPKYGTDKGAFGARIGAALLRQTSQAVLTEGIGASLFHDDPRFYTMGDGHNFGRRVLYAASRVVSTRSDTGAERPNAPLLLGYLGAAALTQTYYPTASRGPKVVFTGYVLSLGAAALGYEFHEFLGDALRATHLKRD